MRVLYVAKFTKPKDQGQEVTFKDTVTTMTDKHGAYKAHCNTKGTPAQRLNRVLAAWSAGDNVNRNPFLHKSLWEREDKLKSIRTEEYSLAGYEPEADDDRILRDICESET